MTLVDGVGGLDLDGDGLSSKGFDKNDKNLHSTVEVENKTEGRHLLDINDVAENNEGPMTTTI